MKTKLMLVFTTLSVLLLSGCAAEIRPVPAGYMGRVLTPTGWEKETLTAGQVDLREKDVNGNYNVLVLLEATSQTVKEQFLSSDADPAKQDHTDHRVTTKDGAPLAVDVYIRAMLPDEEKTRNDIFTLVTPTSVDNDERVRKIMINNVYERFAALKIRNNIRLIFSGYDSYKEVAANRKAINDAITTMVINTFDVDHVPLKLQDVELSNVIQDPAVVKAQNELAAAETQAASIAKIGQAIRTNPEYREYMKWESLKQIAGNQKGTNTVIVTDGGASTEWAKAQYARGGQ